MIDKSVLDQINISYDTLKFQLEYISSKNKDCYLRVALTQDELLDFCNTSTMLDSLYIDSVITKFKEIAKLQNINGISDGNLKMLIEKIKESTPGYYLK